MPQGPPENVKSMLSYSSVPPQTREDVTCALKAHFFGYIVWEGLDDFIASLPFPLQEVLTIHYGEVRTQMETAEVMGCSPSFVKKYLAQAKDAILKWAVSNTT